MFGRRRRREDVEARSAVIAALARLEQGLDEQARWHAATDVTVQELHSMFVETRSDLIKSVQYLYSVCSRLMERTESEQLERQALMGALRELSGSAVIELDPPGERVVGGSFTASPPETVDAAILGGEQDRPRWA